jgi:hypothetical protein
VHSSNGSSPFDRSFRDVARETRSAESREDRRKFWSQRRIAEDEATTIGLLTDLAEASQRVGIVTAAGTTLNGFVRTIGRNFVSLAPAPLLEANVFVPEWSIEAIVLADRDGPVGSPKRVEGVDLRAALEPFAEERRFATVRLSCRVMLEGILVSIGQDSIALSRRGAPRSLKATSYVRFSAVSELFLPASG